MKTVAVAASLFTILAVAVVCSVLIWVRIGEVDIDLLGIFIISGGIAVALGLGIGLMRLAYRSEHGGTRGR